MSRFGGKELRSQINHRVPIPLAPAMLFSKIAHFQHLEEESGDPLDPGPVLPGAHEHIAPTLHPDSGKSRRVVAEAASLAKSNNKLEGEPQGSPSNLLFCHTGRESCLQSMLQGEEGPTQVEH